MDFIFELLFELILEGSIEAAGEKKVPLVLRILCAAVLVIVYVGLIGMFLHLAVVNRSVPIFLITVALALIIIFAFGYKFKMIKRKRK